MLESIVMDPRLWELLNLPPGSVYIEHVYLSHVGSTLTLNCKAFGEAYPKGKPFQIQFRNCRDIRWEAVDPNAGEEAAEALGVYLGEHAHHKPAVVYTGATEMTVLYNEINVRA